MVDIDRFYEMLDEVCGELPDDFFRDLHYGVQLSEEYKPSPYAENDDMVIMGEYTRSRQGNKITIYYGSFARTCGWMSEEQLGADSLEHEDIEEIKEMVYAREERKNNKG